VSNFEDAEAVLIVLKISTRSLYLGAYSKTQQWLFERVKTLRVEERLTFAQIAQHLTKFGMKSVRGKELSAVNRPGPIHCIKLVCGFYYGHFGSFLLLFEV